MGAGPSWSTTLLPGLVVAGPRAAERLRSGSCRRCRQRAQLRHSVADIGAPPRIDGCVDLLGWWRHRVAGGARMQQVNEIASVAGVVVALGQLP